MPDKGGVGKPEHEPVDWLTFSVLMAYLVVTLAFTVSSFWGTVV